MLLVEVKLARFLSRPSYAIPVGSSLAGIYAHQNIIDSFNLTVEWNIKSEMVRFLKFRMLLGI